MRHSARKTNNAVMYGVMGMAVVVLLVVLMFLGWMGNPKAEGESDSEENTGIMAPEGQK